ncbi:hypothetical protein DL93DRAFT_2089098 [Clavulina sp. PMI_390]|nr:hypothetical protein DL93DRAFT_2089098 [Clavulina sp. PMI_390]
MIILTHSISSGADYDLQSVNAADLDPHAVASLFKLFLRSSAYSHYCSSLFVY